MSWNGCSVAAVSRSSTLFLGEATGAGEAGASSNVSIAETVPWILQATGSTCRAMSPDNRVMSGSLVFTAENPLRSRPRTGGAS